MDCLERDDETMITLSADYKKCFDHIEYKSLFKAMKVFIFEPYLIGWLCNGATSQVMNQGFLSEKIKIKHGCKQGAPMRS